MENKSKYENAISVLQETKPLLTDEAQKEVDDKIQEFRNKASESQFVKIPLVGVFSAGKSSLLNAFSERPGMLPVDTTPETAVAYELYYAPIETVELYREGKQIESRPLTEIKQLSTKPGDIAKVYCKSNKIKELEMRGVILVDMPGIGSGIERHDAAIANYISRGNAFILIVDADQGSLRGSSLAFLNELGHYNMYPAVLVSKTDKKASEEVKDIVEYIKYQMSKTGNGNPYISTVCSVNNDFDGLSSYLSQIDSEKMLSTILGDKLKHIIKSVIDQLKIRVQLRTKDIENVDEKIKNIEEEINNVKADLTSDTGSADSPEKSTQDILDNVQMALEAKATDIAQMIVDKEDKENIKATIISIVRMEVISSFKEESEQYSTALGSAIQESIKDIATIEIDGDVMGDFADIYEIVYEYVNDLLSLGGIWGEIAKVLLPFLPDLINWMFGKSNEELVEEARKKVLNKCVRQVITGLRPTILKMTTDNQKRIKEKIQGERNARMEKVKEGLREKKEDANKSKQEVEAEIAQLNEAISKLNELTKSI